MRRVVIQATCTLHETVDLDEWCARVHMSVRDSVRADTRNVDADDDSITVFVIRVYETTPRLINRTKHTRKRSRRKEPQDGET